MKKFTKKTNIIVSVLICVIMIAGFILCYIPMTFGARTYLSFSGTVNVSSDIMGGMYGEYNILGETDKKTLVDSMEKVRRVFEEYGYKNVNVYSYGNSKLRVEIGYPRGNKSFAYAYSELNVVSNGKFFLSSAYEATTTDAVVVDGNECVEKVEVYTNNSVKYISVIFNEKGQEQYRDLVAAANGSIYIHLGDYSQQINASNVTDYTTFTLSDNDYANLISLEQRVVIGCMGIEIDQNNYVIETMSSNLSAGSSSPEEAGFAFNTVSIIMLCLLAAAMILLLALFAVRFGLFAVIVAITMLFNSYLFLIFMNLMPSVEIGGAGIVSLILSLAIMYMFTYIYADRVKREYNLGKSFNASLETAYKKTLPNTLISNIALLVSALIIFAFSFGELTSALVIFAVCMGLSLLTNLLIVPLLVKVAISYKKIGVKTFMLKKRAISLDSSDEEEQ